MDLKSEIIIEPLENLQYGWFSKSMPSSQFCDKTGFKFENFATECMQIHRDFVSNFVWFHPNMSPV